MPQTLHKAERLCRKKLIEELFGGKARSFTSFPLRVVFLPVADQPCPATILVSVSKRRFKRAVKRNRVKRQIREAYRLNKQLLLPALQAQGQQLVIAFIYLSDKLLPTQQIQGQMRQILLRLAEQTQQQPVPQKLTHPQPMAQQPVQQQNANQQSMQEQSMQEQQ